MTQEELVSQFKERIGTDSNISERTIKEFVPTVFSQFEDDTKVTDDTYTPYVTLLKSVGGQVRHEVSEGINSFKAGDEFKGILAKNLADFKAGDEYKTLVNAAVEAAKKEWEKSNSSQQQQQQQQQEPTVDQKIADAVAKAMAGLTGEEGAIGKLTKTVTDFTTNYQQQQKTAREGEIKNSLKEYLEGRKADKPAVINLAIERLALGDNPDLNTLKAQVEANYEKFYKEFYGEGTKPFGGESTGGTTGADQILKQRLEAMKKANEESATNAEALRKTFV